MNFFRTVLIALITMMQGSDKLPQKQKQHKMSAKRPVCAETGETERDTETIEFSRHFHRIGGEHCSTIKNKFSLSLEVDPKHVEILSVVPTLDWDMDRFECKLTHEYHVRVSCSRDMFENNFFWIRECSSAHYVPFSLWGKDKECRRVAAILGARMVNEGLSDHNQQTHPECFDDDDQHSENTARLSKIDDDFPWFNV